MECATLKVGSTYRFKKSDVDEFMDHITSQMNIHDNDLKNLIRW